jgi:mandelate racemase
MRRPLGTSAKSIDKDCLLLVDLLTQDGIEGHAYAFCYQPSIARSLVPIVVELGGQLAGSPLLPVDLAHAVSRHFRLPGLTGPLAMVASSVDTAVWDACEIGRQAACDLSWSKPSPGPRLQQQWTWIDAA